jgi:hypothetical protein
MVENTSNQLSQARRGRGLDALMLAHVPTKTPNNENPTAVLSLTPAQFAIRLGGTSDNSPTFQRRFNIRSWCQLRLSPGGTAETLVKKFPDLRSVTVDNAR